MSDAQAPDADPATAEAAALLEALRAVPPAEPAGPSPLDIGKAACTRMELQPHKVADLDDAGAKVVRRTLGMSDGAEVTNLDRYTAEAVQARAATRWQQLDERAAATGWRTVSHAEAQRLGRTDAEYKTWLAGRVRYDPTYKPPTFGVRPGMSPAPEPAYTGAAMDSALRAALRAARQTPREIEITGDGITPHR